MTRTVRIWLAILTLCAFGVPGFAGQDGPKNGTVLIIRHGEKKDPEDKTDHGLTPVGNDRAQKYVRFFQPFKFEEKELKIDALYAAEDSDASWRPRLTLKPLADATGLPFDTSVKDKKFDKVVTKLKSGDYDGRTVLICWHHGQIPNFLALLGADASKLLGSDVWPDKVFGWVVILRFGPDGNLIASRVINEGLEPDDKDPEAIVK